MVDYLGFFGWNRKQDVHGEVMIMWSAAVSKCGQRFSLGDVGNNNMWTRPTSLTTRERNQISGANIRVAWKNLSIQLTTSRDWWQSTSEISDLWNFVLTVKNCEFLWKNTEYTILTELTTRVGLLCTHTFSTLCTPTRQPILLVVICWTRETTLKQPHPAYLYPQ